MTALAWEDIARRAARILDPPNTRDWTPLPHQVPPDPGAWRLWLLLAGRGAGKTDACAEYVARHVEGPPCISSVPGGHRVAIIAPTLGDAVEACVNGPSGLKAHGADVQLRAGVGGTHVRWASGAEAKLFGCFTPEDVERLRAGGNRCLAWYEELAAWRHLDEAHKQSRFGLRLGPRPHAIASTTPKNRPYLKKLIKHERTVVTRARTWDNPHLDEETRRQLIEDYGSTRLGRQELEAEILEDVEGALWTEQLIDQHRVQHTPPPEQQQRVVVAVDPSGGDQDGNDEQGIVGVCRTPDGHAYVLADRSCSESPAGWGRRAVQLAVDLEADAIVVESNYGGDMAKATLEVAARDMGVVTQIRKITASRGKRQRAEPVAQLYEQGRVHHVGRLAQLEQQMTTWVPDSGTSPDRMDALVWAVSDLLVQQAGGSRSIRVRRPR